MAQGHLGCDYPKTRRGLRLLGGRETGALTSFEGLLDPVRRDGFGEDEVGSFWVISQHKVLQGILQYWGNGRLGKRKDK